jgi:amidohydrolase
MQIVEVTIDTKTLVTFNDSALTAMMVPSLEKAAGKTIHPLPTGQPALKIFPILEPGLPPCSLTLAECQKVWIHPKPAGTIPPIFIIDDSQLDVGVKAFCNLVFDYADLYAGGKIHPGSKKAF